MYIIYIYIYIHTHVYYTCTYYPSMSKEGGEVSRKTSKEKAQVRRVDFIRKAAAKIS